MSEIIKPELIIPPWINSPETFINTREFSAEAKNFLKYGYYINAPVGSYEYREYWEEQKKRCVEGYSLGSVHISGLYYFYLNFTQIEARTKNLKTGRFHVVGLSKWALGLVTRISMFIPRSPI